MHANGSAARTGRRFVLIHGSWHGAWCWFKVATRLRARGHEVVAPDLPSHGHDRTPPAEVTLEHYLARAMDALSADEASIVVAHSRGGLVLSALAERCPERIARAVYLAAVMPAAGHTVFDLLPDAGDSLLPGAMYGDEARTWDMLREDACVPALYADCSEDDVELCRQLLTPEPLAPSLTPLALTPARYGRVPKVYVELTEDRAVPLAWQRKMQANGPCAEVRSIAASHSAYFSRADELARHLHEIALAAGA